MYCRSCDYKNAFTAIKTILDSAKTYNCMICSRKFKVLEEFLGLGEDLIKIDKSLTTKTPEQPKYRVLGLAGM
ncbi:MAG: DNA-directed RNA polymerase subunit RPC12/RpoP [bacterium]|jgi:DNA-directed RNA polymerase subunit RPC12/RpoP